MRLELPLKRIAATASGVVAGVAIAVSVTSFADDPSAALRTIPYEGYIDYNGEPVSASALDFNFALFPCATPGAGQCAPIWVASGDAATWSFVGEWTAGWPVGADPVQVPVFAGRFTVELGADGQNPLPDGTFTEYTNLYLAINVRGTPLGSLQKITPAPRAYAATEAQDFRVRGLLEVEGDAAIDGDAVVGGQLKAVTAIVDKDTGIECTVPNQNEDGTIQCPVAGDPDYGCVNSAGSPCQSKSAGCRIEASLMCAKEPSAWDTANGPNPATWTGTILEVKGAQGRMRFDGNEIQTTDTLRFQNDTKALTQFYGGVQVEGNLGLQGGTMNNPGAGGITIDDGLTVTGGLSLTGADGAGRAGTAGGAYPNHDDDPSAGTGLYDATARTFTGDCGWIIADDTTSAGGSPTIYSLNVPKGDTRSLLCPKHMFLAGLRLQDQDGSATHGVLVHRLYCCKIR